MTDSALPENYFTENMATDNNILIDRMPLEKIAARCKIRVSGRARNSRFRISNRGLELIIPSFMDKQATQNNIVSLLRGHEEWLYASLSEFMRHSMDAFAIEDKLPAKLELKALGKILNIEYCFTDIATDRNSCSRSIKLRYDEKHQKLIMSGQESKIRKTGHRQEVILLFLKKLAKPWLSQRLNQWSESSGLDYKSLSIRAQHTRWGSCTSRKAISLNCKLLFLPPEVVDYVIVHELAHTRHLNHSPSFWQCVENVLPNYATRRKELKRMGKELPAWLWSRNIKPGGHSGLIEQLGG